MTGVQTCALPIYLLLLHLHQTEDMNQANRRCGVPGVCECVCVCEEERASMSERVHLTVKVTMGVIMVTECEGLYVGVCVCEVSAYLTVKVQGL